MEIKKCKYLPNPNPKQMSGKKIILISKISLILEVKGGQMWDKY